MVCASLSHTNARPYALSMLFSLMLISLVYVTHAACNIWASNLGVGCRHASVSELNAMQGSIYIYILAWWLVLVDGWGRKWGRTLNAAWGVLLEWRYEYGWQRWVWSLWIWHEGAWVPIHLLGSEIAPQAPDFGPKPDPVRPFGLPKLPHRRQTSQSCILWGTLAFQNCPTGARLLIVCLIFDHSGNVFWPILLLRWTAERPKNLKKPMVF